MQSCLCPFLQNRLEFDVHVCQCFVWTSHEWTVHNSPTCPSRRISGRVVETMVTLLRLGIRTLPCNLLVNLVYFHVPILVRGRVDAQRFRGCEALNTYSAAKAAIASLREAFRQAIRGECRNQSNGRMIPFH